VIQTQNILLGFYDKFSRKKDKRKISFKHCLIRVNDIEFIVPYIKGDFMWIAGTRGYPGI